MNPYVEEYFSVNIREVDGQLEPFGQQRKRQLNSHGRLLADRLAVVDQIENEIWVVPVAFGCFLWVALVLSWVWLVAIRHPSMAKVYEFARDDLPSWLGMLLFYDLMPALWLLLPALVIVVLPSYFLARKSLARVKRVRARILSAHPLLSEAIEICQQQPS